MEKTVHFPYAEVGHSISLPYLPITLTYADQSLSASGLLDTGSTVNVLPYEMGINLGAVWEEQTIPVTLTGNLAHFDARGLLLSAAVDPFPSVQLAFAWTRAENVPLILGQVNFFMEFDICFYRSRSMFELKPKQSK